MNFPDRDRAGPGRHRGRAAVAATLLFFFVVLVCFPNYCDNCTYRSVTRRLREMADAAPPSGADRAQGVRPACCAASPGEAAAKSRGEEPGRRADRPIPPATPPGHARAISHAEIPYCLTGSLLQSIAGGADLEGQIRRTLAEGRVALPSPPFARSASRSPANRPRAPPA